MERSSCISYDQNVTDPQHVLHNADFDALSALGKLMTLRPPNMEMAHREAIDMCMRHVECFVGEGEGKDQEIIPELGVTYAHLKQRVARVRNPMARKAGSIVRLLLPIAA